MRASLSRLGRFVKWLLAAEDLDAVVPDRREPDPRDGFLTRLFEVESLTVPGPERGEPAREADGGALRFLFAPQELPAAGSGDQAHDGGDRAWSWSVGWLFRSERLDDVVVDEPGGGAPAR